MPAFWKLSDSSIHIVHCNRQIQQKWNIPNEMPVLSINTYQADRDGHSMQDTKNTSKPCKMVTVTGDVNMTY